MARPAPTETSPDRSPRRERADAARNRERVLAAAEGLFRCCDPLSVTMEDVARAAGVGRATLYRRYPDVRSIAVALLDQHEYALQERLIRGDPPLGPGAAPGPRGGSPRISRSCSAYSCGSSRATAIDRTSG